MDHGVIVWEEEDVGLLFPFLLKQNTSEALPTVNPFVSYGLRR